MTAAIERALRRFDRRRRMTGAASAGLTGIALAGGWALAAALVDRWAHLPTAARCGSAGVIVALVAIAFGRGGRAWARRYDAVQAARRIEAMDPAWGERLVTVVSQAGLPAGQRGSPALNAVLTAGVEATLRTRPPTAGRASLRAAAGLLSCVVGAGMILLAMPGLDLPRLLARQVRPLADLPPVTGTKIDLAAHAGTLEQGRSLAVVADVTGDDGPVTLWLTQGGGPPRPLAMHRTLGPRYVLTLLSPQADFDYRVTAGDATAGPVRVRVLRRPGVVSLSMRLAFPAPADRPALTVTPGDGPVRLPAGTRVTLSLRTSERLRGATVRVGPAAYPAAADDGSGDRWSCAFVAVRSGDVRVDLVGAGGVDGPGPDDLRIEVDGDADSAATRPAPSTADGG